MYPIGPSEAGRGDRILAEFQASLLAKDEARNADLVEERVRGINRIAARWALLLAGAALIAMLSANALVTLAVAAGLTVAALAEIWLFIRRKH
jgi:hypothetical protein